MVAPLQIIDRTLLVRRRDRVAARAGEHDFLLQRVAVDLAERLHLMRRSFPVAVNLGAHHGLVSRHIRSVGSVGLVSDAERSPQLLSLCEGPSVLADDEALPFADGSLDLVISGLSLQLVNDLPGTLIQIRRALKPDGLLLAALLGGTTLTELREAWISAEIELKGGASPRVLPFADLRDVGGLLQRAGFALPVVDSDVVKATYASQVALAADLKGMGASNVLAERSRVPVTRRLLARATEIYAERFADENGRVPATFEILTLTAWAPHENQQKPLQPGSAQTRLADALGVKEQKLGNFD
jgi:NADH dehydrogenase [ubiquinone] 1 alpha subcomplex assembly factor 5